MRYQQVQQRSSSSISSISIIVGGWVANTTLSPNTNGGGNQGFEYWSQSEGRSFPDNPTEMVGLANGGGGVV